LLKKNNTLSPSPECSTDENVNTESKIGSVPLAYISLNTCIVRTLNYFSLKKTRAKIIKKYYSKLWNDYY
jgi:hypothetical protein